MGIELQISSAKNNVSDVKNSASEKSMLKLDAPSSSGASDGMEFKAALQSQIQQLEQSQKLSGRVPAKDSMSDKIVQRASDLSDNIKKDHQYVSKMLERASQTGDQTTLLKAMMALNDYQVRVQFVSKTVSKASTSLDQLTRLQ